MSIFILQCTAVEMIYQHLNPKINIIKKTVNDDTIRSIGKS